MPPLLRADLAPFRCHYFAIISLMMRHFSLMSFGFSR